MKHTLTNLFLVILAALALSSCACSNDTLTPPSPSPAVTATPLPAPSFAPEESIVPDETLPSPDGESTATPGEETPPAEGPGMMGIDVSKLILELEKLSEVDTADVVAHEGRALVGLHFDAQYQGTLTERIEEMVVSAVSSVEEMLTDVAVTADPALVEEIRALAEESQGKALDEQQQTKFSELYSKLKPEPAAESSAQ